MTWIEIIGVAFGLACVFLTIRQSIWLWPTGLIQVVLFIWVFGQVRLYSDMVLHIIYVPMQVYGWYHWVTGGAREQARRLPIRRLSLAAALAWAVVAAAAIAGDGYIMKRYFNAALPYWDAAIAVLSLIAQFLLARKVLENWLIWIAVDVIAIGVYAAKSIHLTAGLYGVFLVLASIGWVQWTRAYRGQAVRP
jgi:nicotinamide mononucleotide transporter